jgi:hypothetical protein
MDNSDEQARDLELTLQSAIEILSRSNETHWASRLEDVLPLILRRDVVGLERLLAMFGGMGSINDRSLDDAASSCLSRAYSLANELFREVR